MEIFTYEGDRDSLLEWFVTAGITEAGIVDALKNRDKPGFELSLTINGIEIPVAESFKRLQKHLDAEIEKRTVELVEQSYRDKLQVIHEMIDGVTDSLSNHIKNELGIPVNTDID